MDSVLLTRAEAPMAHGGLGQTTGEGCVFYTGLAPEREFIAEDGHPLPAALGG